MSDSKIHIRERRKKMAKWRILARHKCRIGITITESCLADNDSVRRFTATIRGWQNWLIYEGDCRKIDIQKIVACVMGIRDRIDAGDEEVFSLPMPIMEV